MVKIALVDEFIAAAEASGAEVFRLRGPGDALDYVSRLLQERGQASVLIAADVFEHFPGAARLCSLRPNTKEDWLTTEVGLVRADFGVAETGTLIHLDRTEEERRIWTLPPFCICLLSAESIVQGLDELAPVVAGHLGRHDLQSPDVSLVTGPSRTADIEGQLVCGVHGPKRMIVLLMETELSKNDENH